MIVSLARRTGRQDDKEHFMIRLDNISKQHGHQILFIDASMGIQKGEKVGLVGPNGAGKTTPDASSAPQVAASRVNGNLFASVSEQLLNSALRLSRRKNDRTMSASETRVRRSEEFSAPARDIFHDVLVDQHVVGHAGKPAGAAIRRVDVIIRVGRDPAPAAD